MLTEQECWDKIDDIVGLAVWGSRNKKPPNTVEIEKLEVYVKAILIKRRVEALEEG